MQQRLHYLTLAFALLAFLGRTAAQPCARTGWVASTLPGCGAVIVDQSTGESLRAVSGADLLTGGQYVRFSAVPAFPTGGCPVSNLPIVALTCTSDTLPCTAQFDHAPGSDKMLSRVFEARILDDTQQHCAWDFGDGHTATGKSVTHVYDKPGVYEVCLSVKDQWGCAAQECRKVAVGGGASLSCGYDLVATAVDKILQGKLVPKDPGAAGELLLAQWRLSKHSEVLAETPALLYALPAYGKYIVSAEYAVREPDGSLCFSTASQQLIVSESGDCERPSLADPTAPCAPLNAPVCGCDNRTYQNECEAMAAGVSNWWAGTCEEVHGACMAQLEAQILVGSPVSGFFARFRNRSSGGYVFAQLDFGDGSPLWKGTLVDSMVEHKYSSGGIYRANLTVWSPNGCVSSATQLVVTDALQLTEGQLPPGTDYVLPGDANGDKKANMYDLLNIGVGYGYDLPEGGVPRPNAHTAWVPQFSPNWPDAVGSKVNFKHLDGDGDGGVNAADADVLKQHYQAIEPKKVDWAPQTPRVWLDLKGPDTLKINPLLPGTLSLKADVMVGSPSEPVLGLYGLAFALQYPEFVNHNPEADLFTSGNGLFGEENNLWRSRDLYSRRQLDMGLVKTNHQPVSGYGKMAEVTFSWEYIIIIDIIGREEAKIVPFVVPVTGVRGIDAKGNPKALSVPAALDTIWIKLDDGITPTHQPDLSARVALYPNPATDEALLYTGDLRAESIEAVNLLGQVVHTLTPTDRGSAQRFSVAAWQPGLYTLRVRTDQGMVEKRLLVAD